MNFTQFALSLLCVCDFVYFLVFKIFGSAVDAWRSQSFPHSVPEQLDEQATLPVQNIDFFISSMPLAMSAIASAICRFILKPQLRRSSLSVILPGTAAGGGIAGKLQVGGDSGRALVSPRASAGGAIAGKLQVGGDSERALVSPGASADGAIAGKLQVGGDSERALVSVTRVPVCCASAALSPSTCWGTLAHDGITNVALSTCLHLASFVDPPFLLIIEHLPTAPRPAPQQKRAAAAQKPSQNPPRAIGRHGTRRNREEIQQTQKVSLYI